MSDKRRIDFMAELDRRRGRDDNSESTDEFYFGADDVAEDTAEKDSVPDYMKILYGENAREHMDDVASDENESPKLFYASETQKKTPVETGSRRESKRKGIYGAVEDDFGEDGLLLEDEDGEEVKLPKGASKRSKEGAAAKGSKRSARKAARDKALDDVINEPPVIKPHGEKQRKQIAVRGILLTVIAIILLVVVAVVAVLGINKKAEYTLGYIAQGDIMKKGNGEISFVRRGETLYAPVSGTFVPNVNEGDKVPAGYVIGYITDSSYVGEVEKLRNLDKVILSMHEMSGLTDTISTSDIAALEGADADIAEYRQQLTDMAASGRLTDCGDVLVQLTAALNYRNGLIIGTESGKTTVAELQEEREALAKSLDTHMKPVVAEQSGIVSFHIDNNEAAENTAFEAISAAQDKSQANGENVTAEQLQANMQTKTQESHAGALKNGATYTANTQIQSGNAVARVITSPDYYIVMTSENDYSAYLGKTISFTSKDGKYKSEGRILTMNAGNDGKFSAVIKTNNALRASLKETKDVSFDISKTSGYCVPLSALSDWDKPRRSARLAIVKAGIVQFVYVTVVDSDDEFAIIKNNVFNDADMYYGETPADESEPVFKANDCYVVNAQDVEEGMVIT